MAPLTPEQAQDLVDWAGGIKPAVRATGIPYSSLWNWLRPQRRGELSRHYLATDKGRAVRRSAQQRYRNSYKGGIVQDRYQNKRVLQRLEREADGLR